MKPGCYGSSLCYSASSSTCEVCPYLEQCKTVSMTLESETLRKMTAIKFEPRTKLAEVKGKTNGENADRVADISKKLESYFKRRKMTKDVAAMSRMTGRAKRDYESCLEKSVDFHAIRQGENPFNEEVFAYLKHTVDRLFEFGAVRRKDVTEYLQEKGIGSAPQMASYALKILSCLEIIGKEGNVYCLRR